MLLICRYSTARMLMLLGKRRGIQGKFFVRYAVLFDLH